MFLHRSQHARVALNSPAVVIADVAYTHLHKLLLAGKTPTIKAFRFRMLQTPSIGPLSIQCATLDMLCSNVSRIEDRA